MSGYSRVYRKINEEGKTQAKIRIMQWNVFAQGFVPLDQFVHCPPSDLELERRCELMANEVSRLDPDVICLQEVDMFSCLLNKLNATRVAYGGHWSPKLDSPCLNIPGNIGPDGVAVIYKSDHLNHINSQEVPLDNSGRRNALLSTFTRVLDQECELTACTFHVMSLHLKASPQYSDRRLEQSKSVISSICNPHAKSSTHRLPLFICGDFNAEAHEPAMQFFKSFAEPDQPEWMLRSAYAEANGGHEPEFTTWKIRYTENNQSPIEICHTIDYILYPHQLAKLLGIWIIPSKRTIGSKALPTSQFPSDHMNLVADFELLP